MSNKYDLAIQRKKEIVAKYGGKNLSEKLNISHPAVSKWEVIPQLRAYQIASFGDYKLEKKKGERIKKSDNMKIAKIEKKLNKQAF